MIESSFATTIAGNAFVDARQAFILCVCLYPLRFFPVV